MIKRIRNHDFAVPNKVTDLGCVVIYKYLLLQMTSLTTKVKKLMHIYKQVASSNLQWDNLITQE